MVLVAHTRAFTPMAVDLTSPEIVHEQDA